MRVLFNKSYDEVQSNTFINNFNYKAKKLPPIIRENLLLKKIYSAIFTLLFKRKSQILIKSIVGLREYLYHLEKKRDLEINDLRSLILKNEKYHQEKNLEVETLYKVATESPDHINPTGTKEDDTRCPAFVTKINNFFGKKINYLDIGCSSGGLVYDFIEKNNFAVGIEGSDFSKLSQRSFWKIIPDNLFTADITKKFEIKNNKEIVKFNCISAFEVLEHIETEDLDQVMKNINTHLDNDGIFLGSIGTSVSFATNGTPLHLTVWEPKKWMDYLNKYFKESKELDFTFDEFPRGTGNGYMDPDFTKNPIGFHFFLRKK